MALGALAPAAVLYALMLIVDPYDSVPFSPDWERYPVRGDHRHWNAKLVRKPGFDSVVIGTSSSMPIKPSELDAAFGGAFVNLSMPAATPFESLRLLERFRAAHPSLRTLIVALDTLWCHPDGSPPFVNEKLRKASPEWLYDESPWNDLPPFNKTSLKAAYDQARALLGLFARYPRWLDGYDDLSKTLHRDNDLPSIRRRIYQGPRDGDLWRKAEHKHTPPVYPDLDRLGRTLAALPPATLKILFFPPYHVFHQPGPGSEQAALWNGCKSKAAAVADSVDGTVLVDFLRPSRITREDAHYVDGYHYNAAIASELTQYLDDIAHGNASEREEFRVLARSRAKTPQAARR